MSGLHSAMTILMVASVAGLQGKVSQNKNVANDEEGMNRTSTSCMNPGKLYFSHIMKDGGSSIDAYLNCLCEGYGCSVWHVEGEHLNGDTSCSEATVCTSHSSVYARGGDSECGPAFEGSDVFTALREPVDRLFSFFVYMKYKKKDSYFVGKDFQKVLTTYDDCYKKQSWFTCQELNNSMIGKYFNNPLTDMLREKSPVELAGAESAFRTTTSRDLGSAKEMLSSFDAVFFTEDFGRFPKLFKKSGLTLSWVGESCNLTDENVGAEVCPDCKITATEKALATKLNWADIELYNWAKNLSNRVQ